MMEVISQSINTLMPYLNFGTFAIMVFVAIKIVLASSSRWSDREQNYYVLLHNLGNWKNSISDGLEYYQEPGSWNKDEPERHKEYRAKGSLAREKIREQLSTARVFLSDKSTNTIEELLGNHWYISEYGATSVADYLRQMSDEVQRTYDVILHDAKKDLSKNRRLRFMQKLLTKDS